LIAVIRLPSGDHHDHVRNSASAAYQLCTISVGQRGSADRRPNGSVEITWLVEEV
jgi:hypothetical protein